MAKESTKKAAGKTARKASTPPAEPAKQAPAAKTAVKKAPAKRAVAKKAPTKKAAVPAKKAAVAPAKKAAAAPKKSTAPKAAPKPALPSNLTTIVAKVDVGYGNALYLRGAGAGLSWEKGILMGCAGADEWVWSSEAVDGELEFKFLLNDERWADGPNAFVTAGERIVVLPQF
ncbi:MAG: hypothetical protein ACOC3I_00145 [Verrucomicrobiota bacterium]